MSELYVGKVADFADIDHRTGASGAIALALVAAGGRLPVAAQATPDAVVTVGIEPKILPFDSAAKMMPPAGPGPYRRVR